jgi:hypothetical protein
MTNNETFYFLGKCLSLIENDERVEEVVNTISHGEVDWDRFVAIASGHLVLPSVYLRFKRHGILSLLPAELSDHLEMVYKLNHQRNTSILVQVDCINRLFATVGIVPIYLKGTANLLDNLYEDVGERMVGDIDLLVSDAEFIKAANLLKDEGYESNYPFFEDDQPATKHFPRLVHPTELADVEVHRVPVEIDLSAHFNYTEISPEKKLVETNPPCYVLSDRHKVVLNFMHAFMANDARLMHMVTFRNMTDLFFLSHRVDVYEVLKQLPQYTTKALVYADFVNHIMYFDTSRQPGSLSMRFIKKQDLLRKSKFRYRFKWSTFYLSNRIWKGYFMNALGVIFSSQIRRSVFQRLSNPNWYKGHLKSYADSFKQNL